MDSTPLIEFIKLRNELNEQILTQKVRSQIIEQLKSFSPQIAFDQNFNILDLETQEPSIFFPKWNEGICCYCGEACNPNSQACGACMRGSKPVRFWFYDKDGKIYYKYNVNQKYYTCL